MTRLGQGDLILRNHRVGQIWVSEVEADQAFQPRLLLQAGCQLQDVPARSRPNRPAQKALTGFRIATLGGQLRWESESGPVIGDLSFPMKLEHTQSYAYLVEGLFTMCCDIPLQVLKRLEDKRGGMAVILWMDLAGSWAIDGSIEPILQNPWRITVPTAMWDKFLVDMDYGDYDVLEVRRVLTEGGDLQAAVDQLRAARVLVQTDPVEAVGKCRQVIECLVKALKGQGFKGIAGYLEECTDARRGEEYGNIVFAIKRLTSMPHHIYAEDSRFAHPEARALVRLCEALVGIVGELSIRRE